MIRVLIDECLPRQLLQWLTELKPAWMVQSVQGAGWASMKNGVLLREANGKFDVLVTADKNMHHQQNFLGLDISVLVFPTNRAKLVRAGVNALIQSLENVQPGQKTVMDFKTVEDWSKSKLDVVVEKEGVTHHIFCP